MDNIIKGLNNLKGIDQAVIDKLEHAALLHRRHSRIEFKIIEATEKSVTIQVVQGKSTAENYFQSKRLIEIVHETFKAALPGTKIIARPIPYTASPVEQVDVKWIRGKMTSTGTTLKQLVDDTGLGKSNLSSILNENVPLSQVMKVVFYYYFAAKEARTGNPIPQLNRK